MKNTKDPRSVIIDILRTNLIGPANEMYDRYHQEEIISTKPLNKYYSAILFPRIDGDNCEYDETISNEEEVVVLDSNEDTIENDAFVTDDVLEREETKDEDIGVSELYPRSLGLTFCIRKNTESFTCISKFGTYEAISPTDDSYSMYAVKMTQADFRIIQNMSSNIGEHDIMLRDLFRFDESSSTVKLSRPLNGKMAGIRTGDFKALDSIWSILVQRSKEGDVDSRKSYKEKMVIYAKLMALSKGAWKRRDHSYTKEVLVDDIITLGSVSLNLAQSGDKSDKKSNFSITLDIKALRVIDDKLLVRVVLVNSSSAKLPIYIPNNEILNALAIFQCSIQIDSSNILPLPTYLSHTNQTQEDRIFDCQYRGRHQYGQAHNCSLERVFNNGVLALKSTFMPMVKPEVMVSNTDIESINDVLGVHRNSTFSKSDDQMIIAGLVTICEEYKLWIEMQNNSATEIQPEFSSIAEDIVSEQRDALDRMIRGIELLRENKEILNCYKLANASMLVNMLMTTKSYDLRQDPQFYYTSEFNEIRYHLFQIAFLLINIEGIVMPDSRSRKDVVDILWFPTGGGKTEAYLLLAAFTLIWRRIKYTDAGFGTSVIMRYTLRLLTSQQFERASKIILAMNFVCDSYAPELISDVPFSIGLWIGGQSSPNKLKGDGSAEDCISDIIDKTNLEYAKRDNKFPIDTCPWCGSNLINVNDHGTIYTGYSVRKDGFQVSCLNSDCYFVRSLPIDCIDESLYANPPSLLFATIDKFAQLAWKSETRAFFGSNNSNIPPDLIIQDELHLVSGPLGTISGLFENVVELMCSRDKHIPKIIASTATLKNASSQVDKLYGNRKASTFPPPGLDYNDNFFAIASKDDPNREYIGVYPTGKTFISTQIKLISLLLYSRWRLYENGIIGIDNYWSLVSYHNSLRELGRIVNKTGDEISHTYKSLINRDYPEMLWRSRINYPKELTGRISGYSIKTALTNISKKNIDAGDIDQSIAQSVDLVYATNMISVGLDIERLNLMLVNGQPRSISEYIQVTSRIARKYPGLIVSAFNPVRIRDRSHFESFEQFHESYYRYIEPVSVTPFTKAAIDRMAATILSAYLRVKMGIEKVVDITDGVMDELFKYFDDRINDKEMYNYLLKVIQCHLDYAKDLLCKPDATIGKDLLHKPQQVDENNRVDGMWVAMDSMRDVGANAVLKVHIPRRKHSYEKFD